MSLLSSVVCEDYAGLRAQGLGLAEAAGLSPAMVTLRPRAPWRWVGAAAWPAPLAAVRLRGAPEGLLFTVGGVGGAVGAACRAAGRVVVQVQNPRMDLRRFDLVVANAHDGLVGPNVIVTRTALHRANAARLAAARTVWAPVLAHLPRPLVAVLVGGSNGRFRLGAAEGAALAGRLAGMMDADRVGVALTASRRTAAVVAGQLRDGLEPRGAWIWDGAGENPYFGLLALADALVVTVDSISMVSEAVATDVPVLLAELPGRSRRIGLFRRGLEKAGRVRVFCGRLERWPVEAMDDTGWAGGEVRRRLGF